jgi:hypothetical protein
VIRAPSRAWWALVAIAIARSSAASAHEPGKKDAEVTKLFKQAIDDDYLAVALDKAEAKLEKAIKICGAENCSAPVLGKLYMGLAVVHGLGQKNMDVAKGDLTNAVEADPHVAVIEGLTSPDFDAALKDARKKAHADVADEGPPPDKAPDDETKKPDEGDKPPPKETPGSKTPSNVEETLGFEVAGYIDNTATEVLSPSSRFGFENEVAGWGVEASLLVDVVTSASTDIVATASPRWTDERVAPALSGHFKAGNATINLGADSSVESDYIAAGGNVGAAIDFAEKTITPSLSYAFEYNLAGRRGTPYDVYQRVLYSHALDLGIDFVLDKSTILVPNVTAVLEFGDSAKPYRWVPTFAPGTKIDPGASVAEVNKKRTNVVLEERVPQARQRYAVSAMLAHRFTAVTLRLDERLYIDTWGLKATTTDFMLPIDASRAFRFWPHVRFHAQTGVDFWQLAYTVKETPDGVVASSLRAGDRELGPLLGLTFGGGFRAGSDTVGVTVAVDGVYTDFLEQLYVTDRLAGFGSTTLEVKF